ncbi:phage antirepressor KilAC domain-containing protein [Streptomyces griseus]|uniref:phage antirepressor KilAC domain-containing protein n=1 Tax=Streptomyces griseus TaxID=1911 RepID=UPI0033A77AD9
MQLDHYGEERWSARDLQQLAGYSKWQEFEKVIAKAKLAIHNSGMEPLDHFTGARKVISGGRWGRQEVDDYRLTRFGAYQVALNGDSSKPQIAAAKTYFAFKTREAELATTAPAVPDTPEAHLALAQNYLAAATELVATKKELEIAAPKAGKWDAFLNAEGLCGMTELADLLRTNVRALTGWLVDEDIFRKQTSRHGGGRNMPRKSYQDAGQFVVKQETKNGFNFPTAYATARGIDLVVDLWDQRPAA